MLFMKRFILSLAICYALVKINSADNYVVEEPTSCEVCKYFVTELQNRLDETGKSKEILRTGHGLDTRNRKEFAYKTSYVNHYLFCDKSEELTLNGSESNKHSELRLVEAMDGICERILKYNMHKERTGSLRFAKGQSETMETLHGLVNKGVKVDLGIPYDLWDEPSVEVTLMKKQCERMLEQHEETIEDWYFNRQSSASLTDHLCRSVVLGQGNQACLDENWTGKEKKYNDDDVDHGEAAAAKTKSKKKKKGKGKKKVKKDKPKGDASSDSDDSDAETKQTVKEEL